MADLIYYHDLQPWGAGSIKVKNYLYNTRFVVREKEFLTDIVTNILSNKNKSAH